MLQAIVYTFTSYNSAYNNRFIKLYNDSDSEIAGFVRDMRLLPQNFNVDNNTLDSIVFSVQIREYPAIKLTVSLVSEAEILFASSS